MRLIGGLRIGQVAGIEIAVDWSLLIIFALVFSTLALGVFPQWHPEWGAAQSWLTALAAAVLFFCSVLAHELAHALVGRTRGVVIRRITLFMFGGMAHMESEPPTWRAELAMAIVGPLASLVIGVNSLWLATVISGPLEIDPDDPGKFLAALSPLATLLIWLGPVNIILGLFNLIPGFPMDGGRVLRALLWAVTGDLQRATHAAARGGQAFAFVLMATGVMMVLGLRLPVIGGSFLGGLWLALIGWFLNNAAVNSYRQMVVQTALHRVPVRQVMITKLVRVDPQVTLNALVDDYLLPSGQRAFPVEADGQFLGLVCMADLGKRQRDGWVSTTVDEVMTPAEHLVSVAPDDPADQALALLARRGVNQLPVMERGKLQGLVRREDLFAWLMIRGGMQVETGG